MLLGLSAVAPTAVRTFSSGVIDLVQLLPGPLRSFLLGAAQLAAVVGPIATAAWLVARRRGRLLLTAAASAGLAALVLSLLQGWLDEHLPPAVDRAQDASSWVTGAAFPSGAYLAALAAVVVVLGADTTREWRRVGVGILVTASIVRIATAVSVPLDVGVTLAVGAAAGSLALVVLGAPQRRLSTAALLADVQALGFPAVGLTEVGNLDGNSRTFSSSDPAAFVKVYGRDERAAELFARTLKALRVRGLEDDRARWSAEATARNEALAGMLAASHDVRVAPVLAVGGNGDGDGITVLGEITGTRLVDLDPTAVDDALLREIWRQADLLHRARLAHRWLDATHLLVGSDGAVTVVDWRWASIGAAPAVLAVDLADLFVSVSAIAGVERTVEAAAAEVAPDALAQALPLLQPLVLSASNKQLVKQQGDLLEEVRTTLAAAIGAEEVKPAEVARLSLARVVGWVGTAVLLYVILGFASNADQVGDALADANWAYVVPILIASFVGYVSGAISLMGVVPQRLPFAQTVQVMYAQSFLNRFTPANAGGMALRAKYLQAHGTDLTVAAAGVGITSAASGAMQVVVFAIVALWAGRSDALEIELPDLSGVAPILAGVLVLAGAVALTPWGRRAIFGTVLPNLANAWSQLRAVASNPAKLGQLFGGALLGKAAGLTSFVLSARALGVEEAAAVLCLLYMTANTVAAAAPTPGGVGAIEAALVAMLTSVGIESGQAISVVVVFRALTYWFPVLPAYLALAHLRRTDVL
jgi:undecaprenyl-diphosphatase